MGYSTGGSSISIGQQLRLSVQRESCLVFEMSNRQDLRLTQDAQGRLDGEIVP